jgi:crotonobetainyl-CoA:carnitine CoA-transferase CaiB-like acyl-CoA transferase
VGETAEREGPLAGLCVLDFTTGAAGFCARLLADLGARVVKVEPPGGEPARATGPLLPGPPPSISFSFLYHNAGKRGITLNIEQDEGKQLLFRLVERSDVLIENFPPGYLAVRGVSARALETARHGLIVVSLTGFGQHGPHSPYRSCDLAAAAWGGMMAVTGHRTSPPLAPFGAQPSYTASLFGAIGALLAVRQRKQTGKGEHVDISLQEAAAATLDHVFTRFFHDGTIACRQGSLHWNGMFRTFPCRDGHFLVSLNLHFETLVAWMDSEGMAEELKDEQWRDDAFRTAHFDRLVEVVARWTKTHTKEELFSLGQALQFPWAPVSTLRDVLDHEQLRVRRFFQDIHQPDGADIPAYPGAPYRFGRAEGDRAKRAPRVGEDNGMIYGGELGISDTELENLSRRGIV